MLTWPRAQKVPLTGDRNFEVQLILNAGGLQARHILDCCKYNVKPFTDIFKSTIVYKLKWFDFECRNINTKLMMSNLNKPNYSNREMKYVVGLPPRCFLGLARFASKCCECLGLLILQYLWSPGQNLTLNAAAGLAELTFEKKKTLRLQIPLDIHPFPSILGQFHSVACLPQNWRGNNFGWCTCLQSYIYVMSIHEIHVF